MALLRLRNLLLLLALLVAGVLAAIVWQRYRPAVELVEVVKSLPTGVDVALQEINYTHTEGGVARWRLVAKQVEHRASEKLTALSALELTFYDVKGVEQGTLKARNGQVDANYSEVKVHDEVEIVSASGYTVKTAALTYSQNDRRIRTDAPVTIISGEMRIDGTGLQLDLETRRLLIFGRVHALIAPQGMKREKS